MTRVLLGCCLLPLLAAGTAAADVVLFKNGDQLHGKVRQLSKGKLEIADTVAGTVKVDMLEVATFSTSESAELVMDDGSIVMQPVEDADEGFVHVAALAPAGVLPLAEIREINPPYVPRVRYGGRLTGALEIDRGNKHETDMDAELILKRTTDWSLLLLRLGYEGERTRDSATGERFTRERSYDVGARYNRNFKRFGRLYGYQNNEWEKDFSKALDPRTRVGAGIGYHWRDSDTMRLSTEAGLAWIRNEYSDGTDTERYLAFRLAWNAERHLSERLELFHHGTWTPSLDAGDDHIIELDAGLRYFLTRNIFSEAKVEWDYDTVPADDAKRQDVLYKFGVGYDF